MLGVKALVRDTTGPAPIAGKSPAFICPACAERARTRTSEEISPTLRRLYYQCTNFKCGMTWTATLQFEHVISPSGVSSEFRPARMRDTKPPGHEFGQVSIFDLLTPPT